VLVQRGDLPIKGAHIAYQFGGQPFSSPLCSVAGTSPAQEFGGGARRETLGYTLREEIPQQDCRRLRARVRSATKSSRLSVSNLRTSTRPSGPSSGWSGARYWFRNAARAVKVASSSSFLRALPTESTLTFAESLGGTSTTSSPAPTSFCATGRPMPAAPSTAQKMLGHSDIMMTLAIYTHATDEMQDAATAALESAFA
jgi:integrase